MAEMMEIRFRAISKSTEKFVFGYVVKREDKTYIICKDSGYEYEVDPDTVGQFIPTLNAYVGDILFSFEGNADMYDAWYGVIAYNEELGRYVIEGCDMTYELDDCLFDGIVGNVFFDKYIIEDFNEYVQFYIDENNIESEQNEDDDEFKDDGPDPDEWYDYKRDMKMFEDSCGGDLFD